MANHNKREQPEGNYFDKYNSENIIIKKIMMNFFQAYDELLSEVKLLRKRDIKTLLEAGCGEGEVTNYLCRHMRGGGYICI